MVSRVSSPLTFGSVQFVSCALTPAWRVDVGGVGVHPEIVAVRVAIKMESKSVTTDLDDDMIHERNSRLNPSCTKSSLWINNDFQSSAWPFRSISRVNGCLAHLGHSEDEVHGWMLRVDAFQLHPLFKTILHCWDSLGLDTWNQIF